MPDQLPLIFLNTHPIQYFAPMYRYLAEQGLDLQVMYCSDKSVQGQMDREFGRKLSWDIPLLEGYNARFFKNYGIGKRGFLSCINPGMMGFLRKQPRSMVVLHSWNYASDWLVLIAAKLAGHRIGFRGESNNSHEMLKPAWKRAIKRPVLQLLFLLIDQFYYIGSQNKSFYQSFGITGKRLIPSPYAVDNHRFRQVAASLSPLQARAGLGIPAEAFVVIYSGKFIAKKRPLDLLRALKMCRQPHLYVLMLGEGKLRPVMEAFIEKNGLQQQVQLTGFVNQAAIPGYYTAADLFVMASDLGETWGLSTNEAMNARLPLLLSHLTGCSADLVKQGENGFVFHTGDTRSLAAYLDSFAQKPAAELAQMGQRSLELVDQFSFQKIAEGFAGASNSFVGDDTLNSNNSRSW